MDVFDVVPDLAEDHRAVVNELVEAHAAGDSPLVQRLTTRLAQIGQDDALGNLFERLRATAKGESYVLG